MVRFYGIDTIVFGLFSETAEKRRVNQPQQVPYVSRPGLILGPISIPILYSFLMSSWFVFF